MVYIVKDNIIFISERGNCRKMQWGPVLLCNSCSIINFYGQMFSAVLNITKQSMPIIERFTWRAQSLVFQNLDLFVRASVLMNIIFWHSYSFMQNKCNLA